MTRISHWGGPGCTKYLSLALRGVPTMVAKKLRRPGLEIRHIKKGRTREADDRPAPSIAAPVNGFAISTRGDENADGGEQYRTSRFHVFVPQAWSGLDTCGGDIRTAPLRPVRHSRQTQP